MPPRRGLAQAQTATDDQARDANLRMMKEKRKQQLEAQLEGKLSLLQQYSNPRGIGMGGHTVPKHDIELLESQIEQIRDALRQLNESGLATSTNIPTSSSGTRNMRSEGNMQPSSRGGFATPSSAHRVEVTPSLVQPGGVPLPVQQAAARNSGKATKRDEVWQSKYNRWLARGGVPTPAASRMGTPGQQGYAPVNIFEGPLPPSEEFPMRQQVPAENSGAPAGVPRTPPQEQMVMPQQVQEAPRFGRRATPPYEQPANPPSRQQQQQQQQQQPPTSAQQPAQRGRRSAQPTSNTSTRPW